MFRNHTAQRTIAAIVLTTFTSLTLYPLTAAAQAKEAVEKAGLLPQQKDEGIIGNAKRYFSKLSGEKKNTSSNAGERFAQLLSEIHGDLKAAVPEAALSREAKQHSKGNFIKADSGTKAQSIRSKRNELKQLYADIEQGFKDTEQHLKQAQLPQEILDRHNIAVAQYQSRKTEFERLMDKMEQADDANNGAERQAALEDLGRFMAKHPNAKPHQYTDPNRLPFRTPDGKVRKPYETKEQYQATLFPPKYEKVMLASTNLDGVKLAQATLPAMPDAKDLAETEDVQITQAIRDKANELENNPVKIYNWVRNNIAFIPSYGSIQGADMTLQNRRGNGFDTASLLIALYRAAGIPARYVYGSIEVPVDKVMNWVGGVTKPEAAQSLLGQGGIPNVAIVAGGSVKSIKMEHVWAEAFVDYGPSRGTVNKSRNTWVPMDASFKQYQFTQGMDIRNKVPIDSQNLLDQIRQGAIVNEAEGYVQNLNQGNLQAQLLDYQNQIKTYIDSQKANATVGDVLGRQKVIEQSHSILLGSLPYKTVTIGNTFQNLPDHLRWKFKTNIYPADGISNGNNPIIELNRSTAKLAGKKITLSFLPAAQADQDLINSYLPKPHADGSPIQLGELPSSLPGYLLKMKAEFRVDGQLIAQTTDSFTMGSEIKQSNQYWNPSNGTWEGSEDNDITVGEYNAIGLDLQGMGAQQLINHQARLDEISSRIAQVQQNPSDTTPLIELNKEQLAGDIVYMAILGYFAYVDSSDNLIARTAGNVTNYRLPSYGRYFSSSQPHYFFGVVRSVSFSGFVMDVDYLRYHATANDANVAASIRFMKQAGVAGSAAEHAVPEAIFRNPNPPTTDQTSVQGVSAVKVLALAAAEGQKVYTLNQNNQQLHASIIYSLQINQDVKAEIANALVNGKEVIVHEKDATVDGWVGSGYIIIDPATGSGAYKIGGGHNGGILIGALIIAVAINILGLLITAASGGTAGFIFIGIMLGLNWILKNAVLNLDPRLDLVIATVEMSMTLAVAALAPELFLVDFIVEGLLYISALYQALFRMARS